MNFGEIQGKLVNFGGIQGKLTGNSGEILGKLGENCRNCVSPMVKLNSQTVKSVSPTSGKKGGNERKLFHKNTPQGNLCETGGGNEREIKGNFVFTTSFNCTVMYMHLVLKHIFIVQLKQYRIVIHVHRFM